MAVDMEKLLERLDDAFTIPTVMQEVQQITANPSANAKRVANAIAKDPVLTGKVMKTVNSSFFGFLFKTNSLQDAVVRLGIKKIRNITFALSIGKLFSKGPKEGDYSRVGVWQHSVAVGIMNELLTTVCPKREARELKGEALLAGLMHDIGIIMEDQHMEKNFLKVMEEAREKKLPLYVVESKRLGFHHGELGQQILKRWRLPGDICEVVGKHHASFSNRLDLLCMLTMMSELLVTVRQVGFCDLPSVPRQTFGRLQMKLGLVGKAVANLRTRFEDKLEEALEIFELEEDAEAKNSNAGEG